MVHKFYVMRPGKMIASIILGQPWQRTYNCRPEWKREGILYTLGEQDIFEPFIGDECYESDTDTNIEEQPKLAELEKQLDPTKQSSHSAFSLPQLRTTRQNSKDVSRVRRQWVPKNIYQPQKGNSYIWIPKKLINPQFLPSNKRKTLLTERRQRNNKQDINTYGKARSYNTLPRRRPQKMEQYKWIPKTILAAQGYYEGNTQIWVPKRRLTDRVATKYTTPKPIAYTKTTGRSQTTT